MKLLASLFLLLSISAFADSNICPDSAEEVMTKIEEQTECYFAAKIARECAWGSSIDVQFVAAASEKCVGFESKLSRSDKKIYKKLLNKCAKKYENEEGTMYRSMSAFCTLSVIELMNELNSEVQ